VTRTATHRRLRCVVAARRPAVCATTRCRRRGGTVNLTEGHTLVYRQAHLEHPPVSRPLLELASIPDAGGTPDWVLRFVEAGRPEHGAPVELHTVLTTGLYRTMLEVGELFGYLARERPATVAELVGYLTHLGARDVTRPSPESEQR
jgi:hypothetical protein